MWPLASPTLETNRRAVRPDAAARCQWIQSKTGLENASKAIVVRGGGHRREDVRQSVQFSLLLPR